jgi:transcriptional regulator with XRE-family HTH domain
MWVFTPGLDGVSKEMKIPIACTSHRCMTTTESGLKTTKTYYVDPPPEMKPPKDDPPYEVERKYIRNKIRSIGISQTKLAAQLEISGPRLSQWLRGYHGVMSEERIGRVLDWAYGPKQNTSPERVEPPLELSEPKSLLDMLEIWLERLATDLSPSIVTHAKKELRAMAARIRTEKEKQYGER